MQSSNAPSIVTYGHDIVCVTLLPVPELYCTRKSGPLCDRDDAAVHHTHATTEDVVVGNPGSNGFTLRTSGPVQILVAKAVYRENDPPSVILDGAVTDTEDIDHMRYRRAVAVFSQTEERHQELLIRRRLLLVPVVVEHWVGFDHPRQLFETRFRHAGFLSKMFIVIGQDTQNLVFSVCRQTLVYVGTIGVARQVAVLEHLV